MTDDYNELRWNVVNKLYNELDKILSKLMKEENMSVFEIQTSLLMLSEKIEQQKFIVYSQILKNEQNVIAPSGMYS